MPPYEQLIGRGFRILRKKNNNIEIKTSRGWSVMENYSDHRWNELMSNDKTLKDYE